MPDKSYVTLEQALCPVCGQAHDTGNLLLDKHLKPRFERHTTTHWALCPEHARLAESGYIALVEVDPKRSNQTGNCTPEQVYRLGRICHVRSSAWDQLFNIPCPQTLAFVPPEVIDQLTQLQEEPRT